MLLSRFLQKMIQCINKYIHKYAKHLLWIKREKIRFTVNSERKKNPWWMSEDQPKYTLKRQWWPTKTNTWLTELPQYKDENGWQFFLKDYVLKEGYVHCASKKSGSLCFHVVWTQRREILPIHGDVSSDHLGAMHANLSYYSTYVDIQYNHIYMCFLDCDKVVFYSLLYRWCKL